MERRAWGLGDVLYVLETRYICFQLHGIHVIPGVADLQYVLVKHGDWFGLHSPFLIPYSLFPILRRSNFAKASRAAFFSASCLVRPLPMPYCWPRIQTAEVKCLL